MLWIRNSRCFPWGWLVAGWKKKERTTLLHVSPPTFSSIQCWTSIPFTSQAAAPASLLAPSARKSAHVDLILWGCTQEEMSSYTSVAMEEAGKIHSCTRIYSVPISSASLHVPCMSSFSSFSLYYIYYTPGSPDILGFPSSMASFFILPVLLVALDSFVSLPLLVFPV